MKLAFTLLFSCLSLFSIDIMAQISVGADSTFTQVIESSDIVAYNTFTNDIPQQKNFKWTRNIIANTDGWEYGICDDITCYGPNIGTAEITLGPSATSILDVHLYPNMIYEGSSMVEIVLEHTNDASQTKSALFFFDSDLTSTSDRVDLDFNIYPNPGNGLFNVANNEEEISGLTIRDIAGRQISSYNITKKELFVNLVDLKAGIYLFQLNDSQGNVLGTKLVSKM